MDSLKAIVRDLAQTVGKLSEQHRAAVLRNGMAEAMNMAFAKAVIRSHPDPCALRDEWDRQISGMLAGGAALGLFETAGAQAFRSAIESDLQDRCPRD